MIIDLRSVPPSMDPVPIPDEVLMNRMRVHRNRLLAESDWAVLADAPTDKNAWFDYRQMLREFPETWIPSTTVEFPSAPVE